MDAIRTPVVHASPSRPPFSARVVVAGALMVLGVVVLPACTSNPTAPASQLGLPKAADVALVRYSSCGQALRNLRAAATVAVGRGVFGVGTSAGAAPGAAASGPSAPRAAGVSGASAPGASGPASAPASGYYSGTNDAVAGVDEPDLIKTNGQRVVTVISGVLRVVDAQTHQLTGSLDLATWPGLDGATAANLLLYGNHALVLLNSYYPVMEPLVPPVAAPGSAGASPMPPATSARESITGPRLLLVDISTGVPKVISEYTMDGWLVDARQVGAIARVVVRSTPRLSFAPAQVMPGGEVGSGVVTGVGGGPGVGAGAGAASRDGVADRAVIARAQLSSWLPRYAVTDGAVHRTGMVSCADISHPAMASYSGGSMLTVLTFDLSADSLGDGQPVTIVADGDTVYSNGASLYIVNDQQWLTPPAGAASGGQGSAHQYVGLYKFSITGPGRPVYEASGTVPGWLLGSQDMTQYALSEWNGALRVATTTGDAFAPDSYGLYDSSYPRSRSAVYELEQVSSQLVIVGKVGGLGVGEQIYAVRFAGPVGYVVTYRQVDPLYTLDLSDPAQPRVVGVLRLRGYSAYLDPIDATHLIGVGQEADAYGETLGTQVSLFDVSDLAAPVRLAAYHLRFGHSEAEFDPHAFLYWPLSRIVVIPETLPYVTPVDGSPGSPPTGLPVSAWPASGALVLRVGDHSLVKLGMIRQPAVPGLPGGGQILRSLVIGNALWTLSDAGLQANDLTTLGPAAWVPFG